MHGMNIPVAVVGTEGFDPNFHVAIIKLAISYTLALAFVFTVIITCLSMLGWVKFADPKQQKRLFVAVVVQLAVGSVGVFFDFLKSNPTEVKEQIQAPIAEQRDAAEMARDAAKAELGQVQSTLAGLKQERTDLEARLTSDRELLETLASDKERLASELAAAETARDTAQETKRQLEAALAVMDAELGQLNSQKAQAAEQLAQIQRDLAAASAQLAAARDEAAKLRGELNIKSTELAKVKSDFASAISKLPQTERVKYGAYRDLAIRGGG
jgi:predicted  nucleic acid-binding Zn-ribbon protein